MKVNTITEAEVETYIRQVESGRAGEFSYFKQAEIFHELLARFKRRAEGVGEELLPKIWPVMCQYFGGLRSEDLTILTGDTGKGKTTFALRYMLSLMQQGFPALLFSLEEGFSNLSKRLGEMVLEKPEKTWDAPTVGLYKTLTDNTAPIYVYQPSDWTKEKRIFDAIKYAAFKYEIRFVVLDNLDYVELEFSNGVTEASAIKNFLIRLTALSKKIKIPILLVAHPAKSGDKGFSEREVGMDELKGSSSIKQLAHTVISLFQNKDQTVIRFHKIRCSDYAANSGKCITFTYDHKRSWLSESCSKPQKIIKGEFHD